MNLYHCYYNYPHLISKKLRREMWGLDNGRKTRMFVEWEGIFEIVYLNKIDNKKDDDRNKGKGGWL